MADAHTHPPAVQRNHPVVFTWNGKDMNPIPFMDALFRKKAARVPSGSGGSGCARLFHAGSFHFMWVKFHI